MIYIYALLIAIAILACQTKPLTSLNTLQTLDSLTSPIPRSGYIYTSWGLQKILFQLVKQKEQQLAIIEGDILLSPSVIADSPAKEELKAFAIRSPSVLWPDGVLAYTLDHHLPYKHRMAFLKGIKNWHSKTNFHWKERSNEEDYVVVKYDATFSGGYSYVGKIGGPQDLMLGSQCLEGCLEHEMGHAMGLWHEQSRPDRDQYLEIHLENVEPAKAFNFNMLNLDAAQHLSPFDYDSIMLYYSFAFSMNKMPTILRKDGVNHGIIRYQFNISPQDAKAVNRLKEQSQDVPIILEYYQKILGMNSITRKDYKEAMDFRNSGKSFYEFKGMLIAKEECQKNISNIYQSIFASPINAEGKGYLEDLLYKEDVAIENLAKHFIASQFVSKSIHTVYQAVLARNASPKELHDQIQFLLDGGNLLLMKASLTQSKI